jgi:hypothetical protein
MSGRIEDNALTRTNGFTAPSFLAFFTGFAIAMVSISLGLLLEFGIALLPSIVQSGGQIIGTRKSCHLDDYKALRSVGPLPDPHLLLKFAANY